MESNRGFVLHHRIADLSSRSLLCVYSALAKLAIYACFLRQWTSDLAGSQLKSKVCAGDLPVSIGEKHGALQKSQWSVKCGGI